MLKFAAAHPVLYRNLKRIRVYSIKGVFNASVIQSPEPVPFSSLDHSSFRQVNPGERWGRIFSCAWIRLDGALPAEIKDPVVLVKTNAEALVFTSDGEPCAALGGFSLPPALPPGSSPFKLIDGIKSSDGIIRLYMDCGYNGIMGVDLFAAKFGGAFIAERDADANGYYYDYLTLFLLAASTEDAALRRRLSSALLSSFRVYLDGNVCGARDILGGELSRPSESEFTFSAVGHGHLDLAWLWPQRETIRKSARTYIHALNNIEKYPGYIYGTSQPQQLAWLEAYYPGIYGRVQQAVKNGRIEMQGGFWCECDANLTGGESLIRQALYGKRFIAEAFDQDVRTCWLPDAFGFNANLPQILRGCGMDYFFTIKLTWNKVNNFPYRTFIWKGIDGSAVTAHIAPEGDYNSAAGPHNLLNGLKKNPERSTGTALLVYGAGDGGGGPGETHLELLNREKNLCGLPKVKEASAAEFFEKLETPEHIYTGELYLETHQGTYTTQAKIKRYNRLCELLLHNAECLSVVDGSYPRDFFDRIWKQVLFHQFHDILPGSSITRVNTEVVADYKRLETELNAYIADKSKCGADSALAFANLTSFERDEFVKHKGRWYRARLSPYSAREAEPPGNAFETLSFTGDSISNGLLSLRFTRGGEIASCTDNAGHELSGGYLNRLTLYTDMPVDVFNAWNIDSQYYKKPHRHPAARRHKTMIDGPRVIRVQEYVFGKSRVIQRVILEAGRDTVLFQTFADWRETHKMLRADFRPADYGGTVKCETAFGYIDRPTTENNSLERAQFEVCCHKWAAVTGNDYGFALLNNCKYGLRAKNGLISLNLLRSPKYPDKTADRGKHRFTYAFCPFASGDLLKVVRESYRLNHPLPPAGRNFEMLAGVSAPSVILETIKSAERGCGVVLRLYECLGRPAAADINVSIPHSAAWIADMLENRLERTKLNGLHFRPFEIKTILLENEGV
jgi:alpha-mannosidase